MCPGFNENEHNISKVKLEPKEEFVLIKEQSNAYNLLLNALITFKLYSNPSTIS